jgi:hypothetical protein
MTDKAAVKIDFVAAAVRGFCGVGQKLRLRLHYDDERRLIVEPDRLRLTEHLHDAIGIFVACL